MKYIDDIPIKTLEEDTFLRSKFVNSILKFITSQENRDSGLVIGIFGEWGTGKTSIINCLDSSLRVNHYNTVYYNPWYFRNEDDLLISLLSTINNKLRGTGEKFRKNLGEFLSGYVALLGPKINLGLAEVSTDEFLKKVGKLISGSNDIVSQKNKINKLLGELKKPLIIFIDDIDRLSNREAFLMFKIIRLIAGFKKIIYVVAFDERIVASSLKNNFAEGEMMDGYAFLDKIISLPLRLPNITQERLLKYTLACMGFEEKNLLKSEDKNDRIFFLISEMCINGGSGLSEIQKGL